MRTDRASEAAVSTVMAFQGDFKRFLKCSFGVTFWQYFMKLCFTVSIGKESRRGLVEWSWLRPSSENAVKLSVWL